MMLSELIITLEQLLEKQDRVVLAPNLDGRFSVGVELLSGENILYIFAGSLEKGNTEADNG